MPASHLAHSERVRLCDLLIEQGESAPTLCEGWLTRDLVAHLFVREHRPAAMPGILLGDGSAGSRPDRWRPHRVATDTWVSSPK